MLAVGAVGLIAFPFLVILHRGDAVRPEWEVGAPNFQYEGRVRTRLSAGSNAILPRTRSILSPVFALAKFVIAGAALLTT